MKPFIIKGLKRKPETIKALLKVSGDALVVKDDIKVMFPSRYVNKGLAVMGDTVSVLSVFAIVDDDGNYAVMNIPTLMELTPNMTDEVEIEGKEYTVLEFSKGDIFMPNINIVKRDSFTFDLFDEFFLHGNIPWFLEYEDVSNIFKYSKKYAGTKLGDNPLGMEVLTSIIARNNKDKTMLFRKLSKDIKSMAKERPSYIALLNIYYTFTSTMSKLSGSYFKEGITAALVNKEDKSNAVEDMIKA